MWYAEPIDLSMRDHKQAEISIMSQKGAHSGRGTTKLSQSLVQKQMMGFFL